MAFARPFAYNPGTSIPGTEQVGSLAIGAPTSGITNNPPFWNGPDEELGYVIAAPVSGNTQPTEIPGVFASLGFYRTNGFSDSDFIDWAQAVSSTYGTPQTFSSASDASNWLTNNGFWNSFIPVTPTPTPTNTQTPTITPTVTPVYYYYFLLNCNLVDNKYGRSTTSLIASTFNISGNTCYSIIGGEPGPYYDYDLDIATLVTDCTDVSCDGPTPTPTNTSTPTPSVTNTETPAVTPTQTPTPTDLSSITTYSISGCTNLNVLVVDLGPGFIIPGDVFYFTFTGATPSGCYSVIGKINAPIDDANIIAFGYGGCNDCEASLVTPTPTATPTTTSTPTPSVTNTQTPTNTETPTPTPTPTSGATGDGWFFYTADNEAPGPPSSNGNTVFILNGLTTYNPNYIGGSFSMYFNNNDSAGTSYASQFSGLDTTGGTITISQGSSVAIYSGTSTNYLTGINWLQFNLSNVAQIIQEASTPFVSGTSINVVVS